MYNTTAFTAKQLTKAGFRHTPDLDFGDDGTNFKMYTYKGIPISYARADGDVYISIRIDYLEGLEYNDYSKLPSYSLTDEFNGVSEHTVDVEKLVANILAVKEDLANAQAILAPIKKELYAKWQEYMGLIAKYDWAVEGFLPPAGTELSREAATEIRENLVKLAAQIRL